MFRATFGSYTWQTIENVQEANDGGRSRQTLSTLWILDLGIVFFFFFLFFCQSKLCDFTDFAPPQ